MRLKTIVIPFSVKDCVFWLWTTGLWSLLAGAPAAAQSPLETEMQRCGTAAYEPFLQQRDPQRRQRMQAFQQQLDQVIGQTRKMRQQTNETIYRIPVVVHVVHNNASGLIGGANNPNISDEQIQSQIQVLNEDYRRQAGTNGYNTHPVGADTGIEFFLATTDPNGNPTGGITRHYYPEKSAFDVVRDNLLLAEIAYWPSDRYLNIWVTRLQQFLGYVPQFPTMAANLSGLEPGETNERTDGCLIDYRAFGRGSGPLLPTYNLGRTTTHEVGHWLGLIHPNGDVDAQDGEVCGDDYVADTPPTQTLNQTTSCRERFSTCSGVRTRDMIENYMMYSPDACMQLFTRGQKERMRTVLAFSPRRAKLIRSVDALPPSQTLRLTLSPNPTKTNLTAEIQFMAPQSFSVTLIDIQGRAVRTLEYATVSRTLIDLPVAGLARGVYFVQVKTDREVVTKRLLID